MIEALPHASRQQWIRFELEESAGLPTEQWSLLVLAAAVLVDGIN